MQDISRVYLNGNFVEADKATISPFDRGFIFGDGIYELIPVYGGRPFHLDQHLERLAENLDAMQLTKPYRNPEWADIIDQLIEPLADQDQAVYLQVTRGVAPRDHAFPENASPTVFAFTKPMHYANADEREHGVSAITANDFRWQRCDIKAISLLANVILRQQAVSQGAAEAILLNAGKVSEGAASNIFIVSKGMIMTPPKDHRILPGITRDLVVELAQAAGIDCQQTDISESRLRDADEVWMTSSTKEILSIVRIDGAPVGDGRPGPLSVQLYDLYQEYKQAFRAGAHQ